MALPDTEIMSVLPGKELPFSLGWAWFDEMDYGTGETLPPTSGVRLGGLKSAVEEVRRLVQAVAETAFERECVFLFGFSSGATVAMEVARSFGGRRIGGCVCVCGGVADGLTLGEFGEGHKWTKTRSARK